MTPHLPKLGALLFVAAMALSLASCGRRGPLEPPPGAPASNAPLTGTPGDYETPANPGELPGKNTAAGAETPPPGAAKPAPPHAPKSFLLDPLL
ncbi:MAG: lipoprotein [Pseudomonadota bacterium]|nr:lipoprotein [Pseudomonadota bacterium]